MACPRCQWVPESPLLLCGCGAHPTPGHQTFETCWSGYYNCRRFTEYVKEANSMKRAGRLEEAAQLLYNLVEATEAEGRVSRAATLIMIDVSRPRCRD